MDLRESVRTVVLARTGIHVTDKAAGVLARVELRKLAKLLAAISGARSAHPEIYAAACDYFGAEALSPVAWCCCGHAHTEEEWAERPALELEPDTRKCVCGRGVRLAQNLQHLLP